MRHFSKLSEEEIKYICSNIPRERIKTYFNRNGKEVTKLRPGYRPQTLAEQDDVLFEYHDKKFIYEFIEKNIESWLTEISKEVDLYVSDGHTKEFAYVNILPNSFFCENIPLYFKLISENYSNDEIKLWILLQEIVLSIKNENKNSNKYNLESIYFEMKHILEKYEKNLEQSKVNTNDEYVQLKLTLEKLENNISDKDEKLNILKTEIEKHETNIKNLKKEMAYYDEKVSEFQIEVKNILENSKENHIEFYETNDISFPLCPRNSEEFEYFEEYLGYNLKFLSNEVYYKEMKKHLSEILFLGQPIIINRKSGINLLKCISNTLVETQNVKILTYDENLTMHQINMFLSVSDRILCLDNFVGNFNETILLSLLERHRNKIIFLTITYDRTLRYVSKEILRYCQYLNFNRIPALNETLILSEDPSNIDEEERKEWQKRDRRYSRKLERILKEFGFLDSVIEQKCSLIYDEISFYGVLIFDVLPYCVDVLQESPYNYSEYMNELKVKDSISKIFKEWFKNE